MTYTFVFFGIEAITCFRIKAVVPVLVKNRAIPLEFFFISRVNLFIYWRRGWPRTNLTTFDYAGSSLVAYIYATSLEILTLFMSLVGAGFDSCIPQSGGGEIRTHEAREGLPLFESGPFNHSGTPPLWRLLIKSIVSFFTLRVTTRRVARATHLPRLAGFNPRPVA